jgi:hypothetical protein
VLYQHPVPESILARIGDITVSFALLELVVQNVAHAQLQVEHPFGQIVTAELSFRNLRALTMSLYRARHGEDANFEALRTMMARAAELAEKRNQITHSEWAAGRTPGTVTRTKTTAKVNRGYRFELTDVSAEDLGAIADDMKRLAWELQHRFAF